MRILLPSRHLLEEIEQWKHQTNVWNLFTLSNISVTHCSGVSLLLWTSKRVRPVNCQILWILLLYKNIFYTLVTFNKTFFEGGFWGKLCPWTLDKTFFTSRTVPERLRCVHCRFFFFFLRFDWQSRINVFLIIAHEKWKLKLRLGKWNVLMDLQWCHYKI